MSSLPWVEVPFHEPPFPKDAIARSEELLREILAMIPAEARTFLPLLKLKYPVHTRQIEEVAGQSGFDAEEIWAATLSYDLAVSSFACSTVAAATDEGPILFRNMDWFPERPIARASRLIPLPHGRNAGFVGGVGVVTALSNNGFSLALNALGVGHVDLMGYPMLLFLRKVLDEAGDFAEAVDMIRTETLMTGGMITVAGRRNGERVVIERWPNQAAVREVEDDSPILTTNHSVTETGESGQCGRFDRLCALLPKLRRNPSDEEMLYLLTDDQVRQSITAQHVIAQPSRNRIRMFVPSELVE